MHEPLIEDALVRLVHRRVRGPVDDRVEKRPLCTSYFWEYTMYA